LRDGAHDRGMPRRMPPMEPGASSRLSGGAPGGPRQLIEIKKNWVKSRSLAFQLARSS
jgi:hypothetical protein